MSRVVCPTCEPFLHGDHEFIRWRVCDYHAKRLW
jgi:hypothetical protein